MPNKNDLDTVREACEWLQVKEHLNPQDVRVMAIARLVLAMLRNREPHRSNLDVALESWVANCAREIRGEK